MHYWVKDLKFRASKNSGEVSAILMLPDPVRWLFVLAHGAGAGMRHQFMENIALKYADRNVGTFRFNFPYMEMGRKVPSSASIAQDTIRSAVNKAISETGQVPIFAGGKSYGGRMTSMAAAEKPLPEVEGLIFLGFPWHQMGKPSVDRVAHLIHVDLPMLFLQGSKDKLAEISLVKPLVRKLGKKATMHVVEHGDHSFHTPKKAGKSENEIWDELCDISVHWAESILH